jgi:hypothetical protein
MPVTSKKEGSFIIDDISLVHIYMYMVACTSTRRHTKCAELFDPEAATADTAGKPVTSHSQPMTGSLYQAPKRAISL